MGSGSNTGLPVSDLVGDSSTTSGNAGVGSVAASTPENVRDAETSSSSEGRMTRPPSNLDLLVQSLPASPPKYSESAMDVSGDDQTKKRSLDEDGFGGEGSSSTIPKASSPTSAIDDDSRMSTQEEEAMIQRSKRKRLSINTSFGQNLVQPNHPPASNTSPASSSSSIAATASAGIPGSAAPPTGDVMDKFQQSLKVKEQQKAIIEARQNAQLRHPGGPSGTAAVAGVLADVRGAGPTPPSNSPPRAGADRADPSSAASAIRPSQQPVRRNSLRNSKNLTIMTPSAGDNHSPGIPSSAGQSGYGSKPASAASHHLPIQPAPAASSATQPSGTPSSSAHPQSAPSSAHATQQHGYSHHHSHSSHHQRHTPLAAKPPTSGMRPPEPIRYPGTAGSATAGGSAVRSQMDAAAPSPRSEFPSRELPLPYSSSHDQPRSPHPGFFADNRGKANNVPPPSPSSAYPGGGGGPAFPLTSMNGPASSMSRPAFISLFESLYDSSEEAPRLTATLRDQVRKSSSLLQTLQASGAMIEGLVRTCFRDMQLQYGEKFGAALADLNKRLEAVEEKLGIPPGGANRGGVGAAGATSSASANATAGTSSVLSAGSGSSGGGGNVSSSYPNNGFRGEPPTPIVSNAPTNLVNAGGSGAGSDATLRSLVERIEYLERRST
ncbi:hypothetical protein HDU76_009193 [Blyttiomyces sp. JEL0837]|nr:hypothetical protein HDU76_009193 [Blyttiomyces sp. JEL0837]